MANRAMNAKLLKNKKRWSDSALGTANRWSDPKPATESKAKKARREQLESIMGKSNRVTMPLPEIARRLYKRGWADTAQYQAALNEMEKLNANQLVEVRRLGNKYN